MPIEGIKQAKLSDVDPTLIMQLIKAVQVCAEVAERLKDGWIDRGNQLSRIEADLAQLKDSADLLNRVVRGDDGENSMVMDVRLGKRDIEDLREDVRELKEQRRESLKSWQAAVMMIASIIISLILSKIFK